MKKWVFHDLKERERFDKEKAGWGVQRRKMWGKNGCQKERKRMNREEKVNRE